MLFATRMILYQKCTFSENLLITSILTKWECGRVWMSTQKQWPPDAQQRRIIPRCKPPKISHCRTVEKVCTYSWLVTTDLHNFFLPLAILIFAFPSFLHSFFVGLISSRLSMRGGDLNNLVPAHRGMTGSLHGMIKIQIPTTDGSLSHIWR